MRPIRSFRSFVELITPLGDGGPVATFLKNKGEGLYLVSLEVQDLDGMVAALREKGLRVGDPVDASGVGRRSELGLQQCTSRRRGVGLGIRHDVLVERPARRIRR